MHGHTPLKGFSTIPLIPLRLQEQVIRPFNYVECPLQWDFGHGLSYTTFEYTDVSLSTQTIDENEPLDVSVTGQNHHIYEQTDVDIVLT